jgi:hypothetical protein
MSITFEIALTIRIAFVIRNRSKFRGGGSDWRRDRRPAAQDRLGRNCTADRQTMAVLSWFQQIRPA